VRDIADKPGCSSDSLRVFYGQARRDPGKEAGPTSAEKARIQELERELRKLRQANEITKKGQRLSCPDGTQLPAPQIADVIHEFREEFGGGPICRVERQPSWPVCDSHDGRLLAFCGVDRIGSGGSFLVVGERCR